MRALGWQTTRATKKVALNSRKSTEHMIVKEGGAHSAESGLTNVFHGYSVRELQKAGRHVRIGSQQMEKLISSFWQNISEMQTSGLQPLPGKIQAPLFNPL